MKKNVLTVLFMLGLAAVCFADANHDERLIGKWKLTRSFSKNNFQSEVETAVLPETIEIKEDGSAIKTSVIFGTETESEYKWSTKEEKGKTYYVKDKSKDKIEYFFNEDGDLNLKTTMTGRAAKSVITDVYKRIE